MVELRTFQEQFKESQVYAQKVGEQLKATPAEINAEAAIQALHITRMSAELARLEGQITKEEYQAIAEAMERKKDILWERKPLKSIHKKHYRKNV